MNAVGTRSRLERGGKGMQISTIYVPLTCASTLQGSPPVCLCMDPYASACLHEHQGEVPCCSYPRCRFRTEESNGMQSHVPGTLLPFYMAWDPYLYSAAPLAAPPRVHAPHLPQPAIVQQRETDSASARR